MPDPTDGETARELEMPFVVVASANGPYDDQSFVAGYEAATFDCTLAAIRTYGGFVERWVPPALVPQLDLIAMKHGQTLKTFETDDSGEWIRIQAGHPGLIDDEPTP